MTGNDHVVGAGPLDGIRVIELSSVLMGPFAGQLLGDLGADVIKVEGGRMDTSRQMDRGPHPELSGVALNLLRNKRSVSLDLKNPEGRSALLSVLDGADVLITNMRKDALRRLQLDYESLAPEFPSLIYVDANGFSSAEENDAGRPAFDDIIQAETGIPGLMGEVWDIPQLLPMAISDKVAGLAVALAAVAAVHYRSTSGRGQHVEVPMFNTMMGFNLVEHLAGGAFEPDQAGYRRYMTQHRGPHKTLDGYLAVLPYSDAQWRALYEAADRAVELEQPWFRDFRARTANAGRVYSSLADILATRTTDEWITICRDNDVPFGLVPTLSQLIGDVKHHRGTLRETVHPIAGPFLAIQPFMDFSESAMSIRLPAPVVGQNTREVLNEAGIPEDHITHLFSSGAAQGPRDYEAESQDASVLGD